MFGAVGVFRPLQQFSECVIAKMGKAMIGIPVDSTQLTRQQLEELDALLQRMLTMTQKIPAANTSSSDTTQLSKPGDMIDPTSITADIPIAAQENTAATNPSRSRDLGVSSGSEDEHMMASRSVLLINPSDLPLAEELEDDVSQKHNYENVNILIYLLIYINYFYSYMCQYLGHIKKILSNRIIRLLLGIIGIALLCYTMLWYFQSQKFLPWTISVPWTLQDWYNIIYLDPDQ